VTLLNRSTDVVTVYAETCHPCVDTDGNKITRPSSVGQVVRAVVQPVSSDESQNAGFESQEKLRLRLVNYPHVLGAQSQVEYRGKRYSVHGDPLDFHSSSRTAHRVYTLIRA
jgi:hypothetical protein